MNKITKLSVVAGLIGFSSTCLGASVIADGRGNGMGNTGVTSADYLLAPFYNPALTAVHRDSDSFGILVPAIGLTARDTDESLQTIDDLQDTITAFENSGSNDPAIATELNNYLTQLSDDKPLAVTGGVGIAVAFPINTLSVNVFTRGYAEVVATTAIAPNNGNAVGDVQTRYENSEVDMIAFGYSEFGVALAKRMDIKGHDVSFGVTPKYQQLRTYKQNLSVEDFDISDYDESETNKNAFNMDLGAAWLHEFYRVGIVVKDLFSKEIETLDVGSGKSTYKLDTQVVISGSYAMEYFVATVDFDLTKQERFTDLNDDTQYLRLGVEGNAFGWAQLRAGYEMDLEDTLDDSFTAGIGISPGDLVSLDFAGSYAGDNQFGLSGNLAFTF
ncbi:type IX secretion system membrane protein PorP/SprF [Vibrio aquaticus]|uniref:Type IX secretion system membrane protein PorP/SprF n=1 Tax=Vibrio aquaticus TaxID=2496559 RepID=A0A3S0N728_9VIBR|nr:conjugal transfer protein TraF [Vibrio aquaticus]RTZ17397.1 type IX secretion system membrane protein PorP/SprF [Vibrio aquaticus]